MFFSKLFFNLLSSLTILKASIDADATDGGMLLENRYGLGFGVKTNDKEKLFGVVMNLLNTPNIKTNWNNKRMKMLTEKVDLTAMLLWLIENFPQSVDRLKNNPDYQNRFIINQSQFQYLFEMDKSGLR